MTGSILALLSNKGSVGRVLNTAERMADLVGGASINALFMRFDAHAAALTKNNSGAGTFEEETTEDEKRFRVHENERSQALWLEFDKWKKCRDGISVNWMEREGKPEEIFEALREKPSFIVVARPDVHPILAEHEAMLAAVFASGHPVLVTPPEAGVGFGRTIAIAWRDDEDTLRIVTDALRLFPNAEKVHLLSGNTQGSSAPNFLKLPARHGATILQHVLPISDGNSLGDVILEAARLLDADLLVSGAACHSTWRILLFGGVTKVLLHKTNIPLLLHRNDKVVPDCQ